MPPKSSTSSGRSSGASKARPSRTSKARPASTRKAAASRPQFKEPAALKRLGRSLETADSALMDLRKKAGRDVSQAAGQLYRDLNKFLSTARRDSRKLSAALRRDFEKASHELERSQRQLKRPASGTRSKPATKRKAPAK